MKKILTIIPINSVFVPRKEQKRDKSKFIKLNKFAFIPFLAFPRNQKQQSNFQQVGDLVTRNILVFVIASCPLI